MRKARGRRWRLRMRRLGGTPPVSGFRLMPFARTTLGLEQPLLESELLKRSRDPLAPIKDAVTADGEVVIPIDVEAFGFWLKAAFGQPVTSGTTPKTYDLPVGQLDPAQHGHRNGDARGAALPCIPAVYWTS